MKRQDVLSWDEYFMSLAYLSSKRSKDPNTQVGAVIVNEENKIVGIGYNGLPQGCSDDEFPWGKTDSDPLNCKYVYVVHAELNAILNANQKLKGCRIYVTLFPCNECSKALIQAGIEEVIYGENKYDDSLAVKASKKMLDSAKVKYRELSKKLEVIVKKEG